VIGLEISTVNLRLACEPESLAKKITSRYHEYSADGTPDYTIVINWEKPSVDALSRGETIDRIEGRYIQGCYIISSPLYTGMINPESAQAELNFCSPTPIDDIEYFLRIILSHGLYKKGGLLLHSAGIVRDDKAYLFFGKSGSGKTTAAQHSMGFNILSDDLVGVLPTDDEVMAYSTPFWNPGWDRHTKAKARVAGFYRLVKSQTVALKPMRESLAVSEILTSIPVVPMNEEFCANLIPTIQDMLSRVGVHYLHLRRDDSFWDVLQPGEERD
jgi:hypothetical protein